MSAAACLSDADTLVSLGAARHTWQGHLRQLVSRALSDRRFRARFALSRVLGVGGMGLVLLARRRSDGGRLAIKLLMGEARGPALARFRREAALLAALDHPNVLALVETGNAAGLPYLATEFMEGGTLRTALRRGPLPLPEAARIAREALAGLAACHARGIVHRDLKPENLLFDASGTTRVADLGVAADYGEATRVTLTGVIVGTPLYMAPEQARGERPGTAADVWAMCAILHEMLAGSPPYPAPTFGSLLAAHRNPPPCLTELLPHLQAAVAHVVRRGLSRSPADRPTHAGELLERLEKALRAPARATPLPNARTIKLPRPPLRRMPTARALAGLALATLVALGACAALPRSAPERITQLESAPWRHGGTETHGESADAANARASSP